MDIKKDKEFVEKWKLRNLIKKLKSYKGNGTSMISLLVKPGQQLPLVTKMLQEEFGTAVNIKSRTNRLSVRTAITSALEKLKTYSRTPPNGLVLLCGYATGEDGKEKKLAYDFEPFKPLNASLYHCDNSFNLTDLEALLEVDEAYGFIVISGQEALFAQLNGDRREVLRVFSVELPKKHNKGGQSAMRYQRLRVEKRQAFVKKTAEVANKLFLQQDGTGARIKGLVIAGPAALKNDLAEEAALDFRLKKVLLKVVDTSYGGEEGFRSAVEQARGALKGVRVVEEQQALGKFFSSLRCEDGLAVFGAETVCNALEAGAVESVFLYEELDCYKVVVTLNGMETTYFLKEEEIFERNRKFQGEIVEKTFVTDFVINNLKNNSFGLILVGKNSPEGKQFVATFNGIGALLKYKIDIQNQECSSEEEEFDYN